MAEGTPAEASAVVTNVRETGLIKVQKVYTGDVAGASTDFTVHVDCAGDAYDQDVALNAGNGWTNTTTSIPTGVQCSLTEVNIPAGWELVSITPDKITVTKGTPAEASVVVTNQRKTGKIKVHKDFPAGDVAGASTDFTVHVDCAGDAFDQDVALNAGNGWTNTTTSIPTGVQCTLTEVNIRGRLAAGRPGHPGHGDGGRGDACRGFGGRDQRPRDRVDQGSEGLHG